MPNGNNGFRRVEVVVFDAMNTILQPKCNEGERDAQVYRRITGLDVETEHLAVYISRVRELIPRQPNEPLDGYWGKVNASVLRGLWPDKYQALAHALRIGRRIHRKILSDSTLYHVTDAMRQDILEWLKTQDVRIALASNQRRRVLNKHLRLSSLDGFFGENIFTADTIGCPKLDPEFWITVREMLGVKHFVSLAHIGNSVRSDVDLARFYGTPTALLDFRRRIGELKIPGVAVVHSEAELRIWLEYLLVRHEKNGNDAIAGVASALVNAEQANNERRP